MSLMIIRRINFLLELYLEYLWATHQIQKGYCILLLDTQKFIVSRNIVFHEDSFPFKEMKMTDLSLPGTFDALESFYDFHFSKEYD